MLKQIVAALAVTGSAAIWMIWPIASAYAETDTAEPAFDLLEKQFRELPMEARQWLGPLFWLHGDESRERLEMYVGKVAEGGNGCFTTESRPHSDWMGEGWYRDLQICLDAAKAHGLKLWIFDEKWWPSGEVGGKVPLKYGSKRLIADQTRIKGPAPFHAEGYAGDQFVAAVAGRATGNGLDADGLLDLSGAIRDGVLDWNAPAGDWSVIKFTWKPSEGRPLVDGASQDCVDWYIQTVYQPHYDRFKNDFGKDILGFFFDEPETRGDWGTGVLSMLEERGVDWKAPLVSCKFPLAGDAQAAAQYQYRDALAETWGRTMYGGISNWCQKHNVTSIGHFLEHRDEYLNPELCAGNMFQLMKYNGMGGIDAVFSQFATGKRAVYDHPTWQTPKLGSSITHVYAKPNDVTMVEIFGARGQDISYPEMKWWTDHMQVSGVNFMIPHSFNPRAPHDVDCPPYFYNGGFEPRWPLYRVYADYTSRLSVMLTGGRHVAPVALLYLGQSAHVGRFVSPDNMSEVLQDALFDCDWMPFDVFEKDTTLAQKSIHLHRESYRILVVPPVEVIPYETLFKIKAFYDAGGIVAGYGFLPSKSATLGRTAADIAALRDAVWGNAQPGSAVCRTSPAGGRSYLLPEEPTVDQIQAVFSGDANMHPTLEILDGKTDGWLHVLHRVKSGRDLFFIANQNSTGDPRTFRMRITAEGVPECWDAMRNEIASVPYTRQGGQVELALTLAPYETTLLVFQPQARSLPDRLDPGKPLNGTAIALVRDPSPEPSEAVLDTANDPAAQLQPCAWMWYPETEAATAAAPGIRYFRKTLNIPGDRAIKSATVLGSADNHFTLYINGEEAGHSDDSPLGWKNPVSLDIAAKLRPGLNQLAIAATNATDAPSPAGLIGRIQITYAQGAPTTLYIDETWKSFNAEQPNWSQANFDDAAWPQATVVAAFGKGPWGMLTGNITLSPVTADPFYGHGEVPAAIDLAKSRVFLELDRVAPEAAARITVNGAYAGGFIEQPLRLDVTKHLKPGKNDFIIEPFAPTSARLIIAE